MLSVVIQAGGASRRMGQDKGLVTFLGQPLVARVLSRVAGLADEVLVTTNNPASYAFLNLPCVPDILPGQGALGGLYTALSASSRVLAAVVACDMPFVSPGLLVAERGLLLREGVDAVVPCTAAGLEPFHAVYRRETCLPHLKVALEAGERRVDSWFAQVNMRYLTPEEIAPHDPQGLAFLNVNTLQDLRRAERIARDL